MNLNKVKLKVKALSLAEEARIIRRLEKTCYDEYGCNEIREHRIFDVRRESRATNLARAFLSGKSYRSIEPSRKPEKELEFFKAKKRLITLAKKYSYTREDVDNAIETWLKD